MQAQQLKGTGVALVTPFTKQGKVDFNALENIIEHTISGNADYLVALGTTAETATLSPEEQTEVAFCIFEKTAKRVPLLIGAGGNDTQAIVTKLQSEKIYAKYDGLLIATPFYNKPNQEGIYRHYETIAKATEQPIVLYNVPSRTGVNMAAETTLRLAKEFSHIIAIKEASGDLTQINRITNQKPAHFEVISGDDGLTLPMLSIGAIGVISVLANALPKEMAALVNAGLSGDYAKAQQHQTALFELSQEIFTEGNPTGIKAVMAEKGLLENVLRLPLVAATDTLKTQLQKLLNISSI